MSVTNIQDLQNRSTAVATETVDGANTAKRIGSLHLDTVDTLNDLIELAKDDINNNASEISILSTTLEQQSTAIQAINTQVEQQSTAIQAINTQVDTHSQQIDAIHTDLQNIGQTSIDMDGRISYNDTRIVALQQAVLNLSTAMGTLQQQVTNMNGAMNNGVEEYAATPDDPNGQYKLFATKYTNGIMIIQGWVAKCSDMFSARFPDGFTFTDTNYSASLVTADANNDLNDNTLNTSKLTDLRTDSFSLTNTKLDVGVLVTTPVGDDAKYSVLFIGRWKPILEIG